MASGFVCDRCGAAVFEGEEASLAVTLTGPGLTTRTVGMLDLCRPCADAVSNIVVRRVITKETRGGAWEVERDA